MKRIVKSLAIAALFGFGLIAVTSAQAAEKTPACQQVVQSLKNEWKAIDFPANSKQTNLHVSGKYGHEHTPAQIAYMKGEIKQADADCKAGYQQTSIQRANSVLALLGTSGDAGETANAAMYPK